MVANDGDAQSADSSNPEERRLREVAGGIMAMAHTFAMDWERSWEFPGFVDGWDAAVEVVPWCPFGGPKAPFRACHDSIIVEHALSKLADVHREPDRPLLVAWLWMAATVLQPGAKATRRDLLMATGMPDIDVDLQPRAVEAGELLRAMGEYPGKKVVDERFHTTKARDWSIDTLKWMQRCPYGDIRYWVTRADP
jgi:hypothetical protein